MFLVPACQNETRIYIFSLFKGLWYLLWIKVLVPTHCECRCKLLTKSKETFFNPLYLLLFNTLFVYGIYQCKAELFFFKMILHLQWLHVAILGYTNNNEANSQIKCAKISNFVLLCEQSNWHCNSNKQDNLLILIHFIETRSLV